MSDHGVTGVREAARAGRRAPAVLLLFALLALIAGVCHGAHGHSLPAAGGPAGTSVSAPVPSHGCEQPGENWSFDAHLPAQATGSQLSAPDAGGAFLVPYDEVFLQAPHTRCVHGRAGPGPKPGSLLIALGVNRN